jgi:hypothetical protein
MTFSLSSEAISTGPFSTAGGDGGIIVFDEENRPVDEAGIFGVSLISKLPSLDASKTPSSAPDAFLFFSSSSYKEPKNGDNNNILFPANINYNAAKK